MRRLTRWRRPPESSTNGPERAMSRGLDFSATAASDGCKVPTSRSMGSRGHLRRRSPLLGRHTISGRTRPIRAARVFKHHPGQVLTRYQRLERLGIPATAPLERHPPLRPIPGERFDRPFGDQSIRPSAAPDTDCGRVTSPAGNGPIRKGLRRSDRRQLRAVGWHSKSDLSARTIYGMLGRTGAEARR
jgi:hypothetical protein